MRLSPAFNQIVEFDPLSYEIVGDLAESWKAAADGLSFDFVIHDGVKWTDGQDLTVDDVVFSVNRMIEAGAPRPATSKLEGYVDRAEKADANTARVHLKFPAGAFLTFLAVDTMKVMAKHVVESGVDLNQWENVVGSGPFMFVGSTAGNWEHAKNPDYFKEGRPFFDGIKVFVITDPGLEIAAFKTGQILMASQGNMNSGLDAFLALEDDPAWTSKIDVWWLPGANNQHLAMNVNQPPFDDARVRRAFFLALDRQALVDGFGLGTFNIGAPMSVANPFALPEEELLKLPGYRQLNGEKHPDDLAEARSLLAAAGYPGGEGFNFTYMTPTVLEHPDVMQIVGEQLKRDLGVNLELQFLEAGAWFGRITGGDYHFSQSGHGPFIADPDDGFSAIHTGPSGRNWSGWSDPDVDRLFLEQRQELDFEKRKQINREMQLLVLTGAPGHIEYWWQPFPQAVSKRIRTEAGPFVPSTAQGLILKHEHEWLEPE